MATSTGNTESIIDKITPRGEVGAFSLFFPIGSSVNKELSPDPSGYISGLPFCPPLPYPPLSIALTPHQQLLIASYVRPDSVSPIPCHQYLLLALLKPNPKAEYRNPSVLEAG